MQFAAPGGGGGEYARFRPAEHEGRLLLVEPIAYRTDIPTERGIAEAVEANIVDLDSNEKFDGALLFGAMLRKDLRNQIGIKVLARLQKAPAISATKNPAWVLKDATGDKAAVEKAEAYLASGLTAPAPASPAPAPVTPAAIAAGIDPAILALLQEQMGAKQVS